MKVYLACADYGRDGDVVEAVYTTREAAEKHAMDYPRDTLNIQEFELRGAPVAEVGALEEDFEMPNAIWLAKFLHDTYERLAHQHGYVTREDTRTFDHESPNGRLMTAVCEELRAALKPLPAAPEGEG